MDGAALYSRSLVAHIDTRACVDIYRVSAVGKGGSLACVDARCVYRGNSSLANRGRAHVERCAVRELEGAAHHTYTAQGHLGLRATCTGIAQVEGASIQAKHTATRNCHTLVNRPKRRICLCIATCGDVNRPATRRVFERSLPAAAVHDSRGRTRGACYRVLTGLHRQLMTRQVYRDRLAYAQSLRRHNICSQREGIALACLVDGISERLIALRGTDVCHALGQTPAQRCVAVVYLCMPINVIALLIRHKSGSQRRDIA